MLDQIESWENAAERRYDEMSQGDGKMKCYCGKIFDPEKEGGPVYDNPYAMPGCGDCLEAAMKECKRHHNNTGQRQTKRGKCRDQLKRIARKLKIKFK